MKKQKKTKTSESMAMVLNMIFKQVYPLWKQYKGNVPESEMKRQDREGDFPRGITALAVARLNRDKSLQKQCELLFS